MPTLKECREEHKRKMVRLGEPYVTLGTFYSRINNGWSVARAVNTPSNVKHTIKKYRGLRKILYKLGRIWKRLWKVKK